MRLIASRGFAALSKPRCGSTSLRRAIDPHLNVAAGDLAIDRADQHPALHPHIPGPYLRKVLERPALDLIITVRHPVDMLWSYYKFFQPDGRGRYNFHPRWHGRNPPDFETWILKGKVGFTADWQTEAPDRITPDDLSPLGLDARAATKDGTLVARVFRIEEPGPLEAWLSDRLRTDVTLAVENRSDKAERPELGAKAMDRIRAMLPLDADIYGL